MPLGFSVLINRMPICRLRYVGVNFIFLFFHSEFILRRNTYLTNENSGDQTPRLAMSDLGLYCLPLCLFLFFFFFFLFFVFLFLFFFFCFEG